MIRKLRRKFIWIATLSVSLVMLVIIGGINLANIWTTNANLDNILLLLTENDGKFPKIKPSHRAEEVVIPPDGTGLSEETQFETRYFFVSTDFDGNVLQLNTGHIAAVSSSGAQKLAYEVLQSGDKTGFRGVYKFLSAEKDYGMLTVFLDCREQLGTIWRVLGVSLAIGAGGLVLIIILISLLSRQAVAPAVESIEKQRRFITDASHEIKTPLTIIAANTDVLEYNTGENEWIASIRNQTGRLGQLVSDLLTLSKLDEGMSSVSFTEFSLSDAVSEISEPYNTVAISRSCTLDLAIEKYISMTGDESGIRRVVSVLLDNAIKYTPDGGKIKVTLKKQGKSARLEVFNTATNINNDSLAHIFDRFYRNDNSRSRETGGYGLGLSIADATVHLHKGSITAKCAPGGICFIVLLPR